MTSTVSALSTKLKIDILGQLKSLKLVLEEKSTDFPFVLDWIAHVQCSQNDTQVGSPPSTF